MCAIIKLCFMSVGWERLSGTRYEETGSSDKFFSLEKGQMRIFPEHCFTNA